MCLSILNEAYEELFKLIQNALKHFDNIDEINIALIGGVTSDEYFREELSNYCNANINKINNIKIKFFIPNTTIQKASAIYASKLNEENMN